jgi:hypothetical protein
MTVYAATGHDQGTQFGLLGVMRTRQWHVPTSHNGCVGTTLRGVRVLPAKNDVPQSLSGCLWDAQRRVRVAPRPKKIFI